MIRRARRLAGLVALAWALVNVLTWWRTRPRRDPEFGFRLSPLTPAESRAARDHEATLLPPAVGPAW